MLAEIRDPQTCNSMKDEERMAAFAYAPDVSHQSRESFSFSLNE